MKKVCSTVSFLNELHDGDAKHLRALYMVPFALIISGGEFCVPIEQDNNLQLFLISYRKGIKLPE